MGDIILKLQMASTKTPTNTERINFLLEKLFDEGSDLSPHSEEGRTKINEAIELTGLETINISHDIDKSQRLVTKIRYSVYDETNGWIDYEDFIYPWGH